MSAKTVSPHRMVWVRYDVSAGPGPALLLVQSFCWAHRHRTEGFLSFADLPEIVGDLVDVGIDLSPTTVPVDWPAVMVQAGFWDARPGGYLIPEFRPAAHGAVLRGGRLVPAEGRS